MSPEELAVLIAAIRLNECLMFDEAATEAMSEVTAGALQRLQQALELAAHPARSFLSFPDPEDLIGRQVRIRMRQPEADPFSSEAQAAMGRHPSSGGPTMQQMSRDQGSAGSVPAGLGPGMPWPPPGQPRNTGHVRDYPSPPTVGRTEEDEDLEEGGEGAVW